MPEQNCSTSGSATLALDTGARWEDGAAIVDVVSDTENGAGVYLVAGAFLSPTDVEDPRGAVGTADQAEALGRRLIAAAAQARALDAALQAG